MFFGWAQRAGGPEAGCGGGRRGGVSARLFATATQPFTEHSTDGPFPWFDCIAAIAALGIVAIVAAWVVVLPLPLLQDLPEWLYQGHLLAQLLRGDPEAAAIVRLTPYLPPNALSQVILALLNLTMPPIPAGRTLILIYLAGFLAVSFLLARSATAGTRGILLLVLIGTFVLSLNFWRGFFNYQLALLLFAWFVWAWTVKGWRNSWLLLGSSVLIFLSHAVLFGAFLLYVFWDEVLRDPRLRLSLPRLRTLAALTPSMALLVWYVAAREAQFEPAGMRDQMLSNDALGQVAVQTTYVKFAVYKLYQVMKLGPMRTFWPEAKVSFLSGYPLLYWAGFIINGLFVAVLVAAIGFSVWRQCRGCRWRGRGMLPAALMLGLAPVLLLAPPSAFHLSNPEERLMLPIAFAIVATVAMPPLALRVLGVLVLCVLPLTASYLMDPNLLVDKSAPSKQIYFTSRSYNFAEHYRWLAAPEAQPLRPIYFDTSLLLPRRHAVEDAPRG